MFSIKRIWIFSFKDAGLLAGADEGWQESFRNKTNALEKKFNKALIKLNVKKGWDGMCRLV